MVIWLFPLLKVSFTLSLTWWFMYISTCMYSTDELDLLSPMIEPGLSFGGWVLTEDKGIVAQCSVDLLVM